MTANIPWPLQYPLPFHQLQDGNLPVLVEITPAEMANSRASIRDLHGRDLLYALDTMSADTGHLRNLIFQLSQLLGGKWPSARETHLPRLEKEIRAIWTDADLYARIQDVDVEGLTLEEHRFLILSLEKFRRNGIGLTLLEQQRLHEINAWLRELTSRYAMNVQASIDTFELVVNMEDLEGVPPHVLKATQQEQGTHRLTLHFPVYGPVMGHAVNRDLREQMWRAWQAVGTQGEQDSRSLIREILQLRREKATLLGYETFAEYAIAPNMAASVAAVDDFLISLETETRPAFEQERADMEAFYRSKVGESAPPLEPWDLFFWMERLREERYALNPAALRPYFTLGGLLEGLFKLCHHLFGVTFQQVDVPVWHDDVQVYEVRDELGKLLGAVYTDWYPRSGKRNSGWVSPVLKGEEVHIAFLCTNLARPREGQPALLGLYDAKVLVHEFGHVLHHLLSHAPLRTLSGMDVPLDFVEVPSQLLENWLSRPESLAWLSPHQQTGEPLPNDLLRAVTQASTFRAATDTMRDLSFAALDLALHENFDPDGEQDPVDLAQSVLARFQPVTLHEAVVFITNFNHYFSQPEGYAACHYSYKWSEVTQAQLFRRFEQDGVLNPRTGRALRDEVLSQGNQRDPRELVNRFLNREP